MLYRSYSKYTSFTMPFHNISLTFRDVAEHFFVCAPAAKTGRAKLGEPLNWERDPPPYHDTKTSRTNLSIGRNAILRHWASGSPARASPPKKKLHELRQECGSAIANSTGIFAGFPHARGDGPLSLHRGRVAARFSPRPWGWSALISEAETSPIVSPRPWGWSALGDRPGPHHLVFPTPWGWSDGRGARGERISVARFVAQGANRLVAPPQFFFN
jgi:hypothetical protein